MINLLMSPFKKQTEMVQYHACFVITKAIKRILRDRIYQELGLESFADRR